MVFCLSWNSYSHYDEKYLFETYLQSILANFLTRFKIFKMQTYDAIMGKVLLRWNTITCNLKRSERGYNSRTHTSTILESVRENVMTETQAGDCHVVRVLVRTCKFKFHL